MEDSAYNNKIIVFGKGDLAKEFACSSNLEMRNVVFVDSILDNQLDYSLLERAEKIYIAISNPDIKKKIFEKLKHHNLRVDSYVSPLAFISSNVRIGEGTIIQPYCVISNNVSIGNLCFINFSCTIGHDVFLGDFSSLMPSVNLGGHVHIGSRVFIGTGSIILPKKKVSDLVKIGAGSVVISSAKKIGTYFGNPASKI